MCIPSSGLMDDSIVALLSICSFILGMTGLYSTNKAVVLFDGAVSSLMLTMAVGGKTCLAAVCIP